MKKILLFLFTIFFLNSIFGFDYDIHSDIQDYYNSENISVYVNSTTQSYNNSFNDSFIYLIMDDDSISGATISDLTSNGLDFTNSGGTTGVTGIINEAISFDGNNDQLSRSTNSNFDSSNSFTINVWFNNTDLTSTQSFVSQRITSDNQWWFGLDSSELVFTYNSGSGFVGTSKTFSDTGNWNMATFTKSGTTIKLYVNGVLQTGTGTTIEGRNNVGFNIGSGSGEDYFDGLIDEVNMYTRALTGDEILELYNQQNDDSRQYPFDDGGDLTDTDLSYYFDNDNLIVEDGLIAYYSAEYNANDELGVYNGTENGGVAYNDSINSNYGQAFSFDGVDHYISTSFTPTLNYSLSFWLKSNIIRTQGIIRDSGSVRLYQSSDSSLEYDDGSLELGNIRTSSNLNPGQWYHIVLTYDSDTMSFYLDNTLIGSESGITLNPLTDPDFSAVAVNRYNGSIDEVRIYNRDLNTTEIELLYNSSPYTSICQNCNQTTFDINNLVEDTYNITFMSRYFNISKDFSESFEVDLTNPTITNNLPSEINTYNINFTQYLNYSDNNSFTGNITTNTYYNETKQNTTSGSEYYININNVDDYCSQQGLSTGEVITSTSSVTTAFWTGASWVPLSSSNGATSFKCVEDVIDITNTSYTFPYNGNQSIDVRVIDIAGNLEEDLNNILLVNPNQYFYFYEEGVPLTNYTFGGKSISSNPATLLTYNDGLSLGINDVQFLKDGFITETFEVNITTTSNINQSYNISPARLELNIYNQLTNTLITGQNLTLDLIGEVSFTNVTSTGMFNISSLLVQGTYQAFIVGENYISNQKTFIFNGDNVLQSNFYMLPYNSSLTGYVTLITYNPDNTFAKQITVTANQWDTNSSTYIETFQTQTNTNGRAIVPIILENKLYKFCAEYPSGTTCFPSGGLGQKISTAQNGEEIPILPDLFFPTYDETINDLRLIIQTNNLTNYSTEYYNYSLVYTWENTLGFDSTVCTKIEKNYNYTKQIVTDTCSTSSSGIYTQDFLLNNSFSYIITIYEKDGLKENELYSYSIKGKDSFFYWIENFQLTPFIGVLLIALMIGVIKFLTSPLLIIIDVIAIFFIFWKYIIPEDLNIITVGIIIVMGLITFRAVNKK